MKRDFFGLLTLGVPATLPVPPDVKQPQPRRRRRPRGGWPWIATGLACLYGLQATALPARAQFSPQRVITTEAAGAAAVFATDLDGDGDQDVVSASVYDDKVAWYENADGAGTFGPQQVITTEADGAQTVYAADLDGDGDQDVLSGSGRDDKVAWYENTDGAGSFCSQQVISTEADEVTSVFAADLDGDGDQDVLSASVFGSQLAWYENTDGAGTFGPSQVLPSVPEEDRTGSVYAADLDGDGDRDVLSASWSDHVADKVAWHENTDGQGTFGPQQVITTGADEALRVYAADLDGDGDQDVLSASIGDSKVAWYENTGGAGTFGPQRVITTEADSTASIFVADLDGDGDQDVLSASLTDGTVAWYENADGAGTFGPQRVITTEARGAASVFAADLDGDGDQDVLSASIDDSKVAWYENESPPVAVGDPDELPSAYHLSAPYPNPFGSATTFSLRLARPQRVTVAVFDALGRRVAEVHAGVLGMGEHRFTFNGGGLSPGLYVVRATGGALGGGLALTRRAVVVR